MKFGIILFLWVYIGRWSQVISAPYGGGPPVRSIKDSDEKLMATSSITVLVEQDAYNSDRLKVSTTRKQDLLDDEGGSIAQTVTILSYVFDLTVSTNYLTKPGIPLRLYPSRTSKVSTFGFVIASPDGASKSSVGPKQSKDKLLTSYRVEQGGPSLWTSRDAEDSGSVELIMELEKEGGDRNIRVQPCVNGKHLEELTLSLAPAQPASPRIYMSGIPPELQQQQQQQQSDYTFTSAPSYNTAGSLRGEVAAATAQNGGSTILDVDLDETTLLDDYLHYYRGMKVLSYTKLRSLEDLCGAAFIGFLSPFLFLGATFVVIAFVVFLLLRREEPREDARNEKGDISLA